MNVRPMSSDWARNVRALVQSVPAHASPSDLRHLASAVGELAWRHDRPSLELVESSAPRYRRMMVSDPGSSGASVLLIAWPAGHRTKLHDHNRLWGMELVLEGALAVDEYVHLGADQKLDPVFRQTTFLGVGDATSFANQEYLHVCRNLSEEKPALTLHVYGGPLLTYSAYEPTGAGHFERLPSRAQIDEVWNDAD